MHPFADLQVAPGSVGIHWFEQNAYALKDAQGTITLVDPYFPHQRPPERVAPLYSPDFSSRRHPSYAALREGSHHGSMIIPFKPDLSHLYLHLTGDVPPRMPLNGDPLSDPAVPQATIWTALTSSKIRSASLPKVRKKRRLFSSILRSGPPVR